MTWGIKKLFKFISSFVLTSVKVNMLEKFQDDVQKSQHCAICCWLAKVAPMHLSLHLS